MKCFHNFPGPVYSIINISISNSSGHITRLSSLIWVTLSVLSPCRSIVENSLYEILEIRIQWFTNTASWQRKINIPKRMTNTGNVVAITPLQAAHPSDQKFSSSFIRQQHAASLAAVNIYSLGISVAVIKIINLEVIPQYVVIYILWLYLLIREKIIMCIVSLILMVS